MRELKFRAWEPSSKRMYPAIVGEPANPSIWTEKNWRECTPEASLMQFAGLLDKNGKEIWEGDLIKFSSEEKSASPFRVYIHLPNGLRVEATNGWHYDWSKIRPTWDEVEVIGNIHENPELLKPSLTKGASE